MYTPAELAEYMAEIREQVCSRCYDRPPGGPPCAPRGKRCGIELHLEEIVQVAACGPQSSHRPVHRTLPLRRVWHCSNRETSQCPCPLDPLLLLAIEAIEAVDERRGQPLPV